MHSSSILAFIAAGSFCVAAPTESQGTGHITTVVQHLEANGHVTWTPAANGGQVATLSAEDVAAAEQITGGAGTRRLARRGTGTDVGGFTNIGQIADHAASYACEKGGKYGVSATIETLASDACSTLLNQVPGAPVAEKAWNVYKGVSQPGPKGDQISTFFRFFYNTASAPALTDTICQTAYKQLTSTFCQGKKDNGKNTKGGEIKVGTGDDYTMIGLDPNSA